MARVKGIPDNTFFVNFFFFLCTYGEDLDFFFSLSLSLLFLPLRDFVRKDIFISDSCVSFFEIIIIIKKTIVLF